MRNERHERMLFVESFYSSLITPIRRNNLFPLRTAQSPASSPLRTTSVCPLDFLSLSDELLETAARRNISGDSLGSKKRAEGRFRSLIATEAADFAVSIRSLRRFHDGARAETLIFFRASNAPPMPLAISYPDAVPRMRDIPKVSRSDGASRRLTRRSIKVAPIVSR